MSDLQALLRFQILDERNATELAQRMLMRAAADHIYELEEVLRKECIYDVGQRDEQWYCMGCGKYADKVEQIQHDDCRVAKALGL